MSRIFTFSEVQQRLDTICGHILAFLENTPYKRQTYRIIQQCNQLRSAFPSLDDYWQQYLVHCLDRALHLSWWSEASLVDVTLRMPSHLHTLEEVIIICCRQAGATIFNPSIFDNDDDEDEDEDEDDENNYDWQDGLLFARQMLRHEIFVEDAIKLTGLDAEEMMRTMQYVLDYTRQTDPCRLTAFYILEQLCRTTLTFKPAVIPTLHIRTDLEPSIIRGYGLISKGSLPSGQLIAMKTAASAFPAIEAKAEIDMQFRREVLLWHQLSHPFILPLLGITDNRAFPETTRMVFPWCQNGNLTQYLRQPGAANVNRLKLLYEVCLGLLYLHDHIPTVLHADLKCANVLIQDDGTPCLTDFGLFNTRYHAFSSSARWMCPERLYSQDDESYIRASSRTESDMWSLGMLFLEAFTGQVPFPHIPDDDNAMLLVSSRIVRGERPVRPREWDIVRYGLDDELWFLLSQCWAGNPCERPTVDIFISVIKRLAGSWLNRYPS